MHANFHFLPRPAQRLDLHAGLIAVNRQVGQLVQRLQLNPLLQFIALEGTPIDAELELQEPSLAGDRMKEPAVALLLRANFNDAPLAPIGLGKITQLMNTINNPLQNPAVPPARLARAADTVVGVPSTPILFPGH